MSSSFHCPLRPVIFFRKGKSLQSVSLTPWKLQHVVNFISAFIYVKVFLSGLHQSSRFLQCYSEVGLSSILDQIHHLIYFSKGWKAENKYLWDLIFSHRCLWRVLSSGIWRPIVRWNSADVSEDHISTFSLEYGANRFLRNIGWILPAYTELYLSRQNCS
jgi:hypothetical protein